MALMNRNDVKKVIEDLNEKPFVCTEHYIETTSGFIITTKEKSKYHRVKKQTNADRIRSMNDEELAEFLKKFDLCTNCRYGEDVRCTFDNPCTHGFATAMAYEWLKSEAKE